MSNERLSDIGIVGMGVMGNNILLNMNDHGFVAAGYDRTSSKVQRLKEESKQVAPGHCIDYASDLKYFTQLLKRPRSIMLLVPAGPAVDAVIQQLLPLLEKGDLIIDAGNSYFKDTDARALKLKEKGIHLMGMGVSGGEKGARLGPSLMPGGMKEDYDRVRLILEAISAKVKEEPCVTYLGRGSSGHFVKMIHNGIEYGIMQLIAESYDLMKRGLGLNNDELRDVFVEWNKGELNSYLMEITSQIFDKVDEKTKNKLIDLILGVAKQTGTGMWTAKSAMELQIPVPTIDAAVNMRDFSVLVTERCEMSKIYKPAYKHSIDNRKEFIADLRQALYTGIMTVYAQGMSVLTVASHKYDYGLDLEAIARIWRGGCIIRAAILEDILAAYKSKKDLSNLLLDTHLSKKIISNQKALRKIVSKAADMNLPAPGLMASLGYFDTLCSHWLPDNLIQAQRDYFGSHQYERTDMAGTFHTEWEEK